MIDLDAEDFLTQSDLESSPFPALAVSLERAILDPAQWRDVCDGVAAALGGIGTIIIPFQPEKRGGWMTHSPSLEASTSVYIRDEWHKRDYRQAATQIMRQRGYATDHDIASPDTLRRHPYYADFLRSQGQGIFIGIHLEIGGQDWVASVQRKAQSGSPTPADLDRVPLLREMLISAGRLSNALGNAKLLTWRSYFEESDRGLLLLGPDGRIRDLNLAAERMLSTLILRTKGLIVLPDAAADESLQKLIAQACRGKALTAPPPVVLEIGPSTCLVFEAFRLPSDLQHFHLEAAAVLIVRLATNPTSDLPERMMARFGLSSSEVRVALGVRSGRSLKSIAAEHALAEGTVRQQLKSIFRKTGAHTQAQLVALMSK